MNGRWRVGPVGSTGAGRPWLVLRGEAIEATQWNGPVLTLDHAPVRRLGPDLLADGSDPAALVRAAPPRRAGSRPLGEVLQDQRLVAGIGNMWMSETLWAVALSPWLPLAQARDDELRAALEWARRRCARPSRARGRRAPCTGAPAGPAAAAGRRSSPADRATTTAPPTGARRASLVSSARWIRFAASAWGTFGG